jgi:hypothetical protein
MGERDRESSIVKRQFENSYLFDHSYGSTGRKTTIHVSRFTIHVQN